MIDDGRSLQSQLHVCASEIEVPDNQMILQQAGESDYDGSSVQSKNNQDQPDNSELETCGAQIELQQNDGQDEINFDP